jgi:hypothetical protein
MLYKLMDYNLPFGDQTVAKDMLYDVCVTMMLTYDHLMDGLALSACVLQPI